MPDVETIEITRAASEPAIAEGTCMDVEAVCAMADVHADDGAVGVTAIDKRPTSFPVTVHALGIRGDIQADRKHHGGADKALYAFAQAEAEYWSAVLKREIPFGFFGENLRVNGSVDAFEFGARIRLGEVEMEATGPRTPCMTFARWMGRPRFVKEFSQRGRHGVYFRVLKAGKIEATDRIEVISTPGHGVTIADWVAEPTVERAEALLESQRAGRLSIADYAAKYVNAVAGRRNA